MSKGCRIPVDKDGYVPRKDLVRRFHEVGNLRDSDHDSSVVLPARVTPEQVREWWDDPSVCDIEGIDTADAACYNVPLSIHGKKRKALKRIAVVSDDKKEAARIKKILANSFTASELDEMCQGRSLLVSIEPGLEDCTGYYLRRQSGVPVPEIVLEQGTTPDGIVHEAVHHLRAVEGRSAFPDRSGILDSGYASLPKTEKDRIVGREERETVVETVARTRVDPVESGYYDRVPGQSSRAAYLHDQRVVSGSKALKGRAAVKAAERNYAATSISRAIISSNKKRGKR